MWNFSMAYSLAKDMTYSCVGSISMPIKSSGRIKANADDARKSFCFFAT